MTHGARTPADRPAGGRVNALAEARELVAADLERFEVYLAEALEPQAEYLSETERELYRRGKKLRPLMLLLAARATEPGGGGDLPEKAVKAAVSLEMLHVATLIHDDIIDVAPMRRGLTSVHAERGTEMAVLIGDLQFIQAIRCFADAIDTQQDMRLVSLVLEAGFKVCCGELDELATDPTWKPNVLIERYFRVVDRKTAMLFGVACECGASLMGARTREIFHISRFGRRFGRAFQIMDDVFDILRSEEVSGKEPGVDLVQRRVTLPMIYAMDELDEDHAVRRILRGEPYDAELLREAVEALRLSDGLLRAYSTAREMAIEGREHLDKLEHSPYRDALEALARFVVDRGSRRDYSEL